MSEGGQEDNGIPREHKLGMLNAGVQIILSMPDLMATPICPICPKAHLGGWVLRGGPVLRGCCRGPFLLC